MRMNIKMNVENETDNIWLFSYPIEQNNIKNKIHIMFPTLKKNG